MQEFVPNAPDGWELALDALASDPESFPPRLRRLGEVTGSMHTRLAADASDPAFAPEEPSQEALPLLVATVDEEIEQLFLDLPDLPVLEPVRGAGRRCASGCARSRASAGRPHDPPPRRLPPRPGALGARRLGHPRLRGRAGAVARRAPPQALAAARRGRDAALVRVRRVGRRAARAAPGRRRAGRRARARSSSPATSRPWTARSSRRARTRSTRLLSLFELEKAVYELRYELNHRPDWLGIPVAGILRLLEE